MRRHILNPGTLDGFEAVHTLAHSVVERKYLQIKTTLLNGMGISKFVVCKEYPKAQDEAKRYMHYSEESMLQHAIDLYNKI